MLAKIVRGIEIVGKDKLFLYCNNKAANSIGHNLVQHDRTKYMEIDRHFIYEKLLNGVLILDYATFNKRLADVFTKEISNKTYHTWICKLGMCDTYALN